MARTKRGARPRARAAKPVARRIAEIQVTDLFGQYSYTIPAKDAHRKLGDIVILYGDNGCGKTTLLRLLFHLLSPAERRSHRTELLKIPFHSVQVLFDDGARVTASRAGAAKQALELTVVLPGEPSISGTYSKKGSFAPAQFEAKFLDGLRRLDLALYYLADDRELISDKLPSRQSPQVILEHMTTKRAWEVAERYRRWESEPNESDVARTLSTAHDWIRKQVIQASNAGAQNANSIYLEILESLSKEEKRKTRQSTTQMSVKLREIQQYGEEFARFGFSPQLDIDKLLSLVESVPKSRKGTMLEILEPYVSGTSARLESLAQIKTATAKLVDGLTSFFSQGKRVEFDVARGFAFIDANGAQLDPTWLSSGEQHLVKLFCCTLISRDEPSIFFVDEPELSLNIKWQRVLIEALSDIVAGSPNQFIFATHSLEILSQYRSNVEHLVPQQQRHRRPSSKDGR